jgi:hypothetical protein
MTFPGRANLRPAVATLITVFRRGLACQTASKTAPLFTSRLSKGHCSLEPTDCARSTPAIARREPSARRDR